MDIRLQTAAPVLSAKTGFLRTGLRPQVVAIVIAIIAAMLLVTLFVHTAIYSQFVDTEAYYSAGLTVRNSGRLYERAFIWRDAGWTLGGPRNPPATALVDYPYAPTFAIAFLPLTFFPFKGAAVVWSALNFGCLLIAATMISARILPRSRYDIATALALCAAVALFPPVRQSLYVGNCDSVLLLLLVLSFTSFVDHRNTRAGAWLALAVVVKPALGFLLLYYIWKKGYGVAAVTVIAAAALLVAPLPIVGLTAVHDFLESSAYWSSATFAVSPVNQSPYGMALRLFTVNDFTIPITAAPVAVTVARVLATAVALLIFAAWTTRKPVAATHRLWLEFGLALLVMLLISPLSEDLHFTYTVIPQVAVTAAIVRGRHWTAAMSVAAATAVIAYLAVCALGASAQYAFNYYAPAPVSGLRAALTGIYLFGLTGLLAILRVIMGRTSDLSNSWSRSG